MGNPPPLVETRRDGDGKLGRARRSRQERGKMETGKPTSQPLGPPHSLRPPGFLPLPLSIVVEGAANSQAPGRGCQESTTTTTPPPRPQHTQRLFFCIEFLLPSSHCISCQEAQSRPFPTYDPGTLGPKRWKKVMYQFIALRRCCAWPLLLEN